VTAQSVQDQEGSAPEDVSVTVTELQRIADTFGSGHPATPGGLPGITSDWVPSHLFDAVFESYRLGTREQRYQTPPDCIVNLAHTRGPGSS
jgi:hypothetical protein